MIIFFSDQLENHYPFFYSPALKPIGQLSLSERLQNFRAYPLVINFKDKIAPWLSVNLLKKELPVFVNASLIPSHDQVKLLTSHLLSFKDNRGWVIFSQKDVIAFSLPFDQYGESQNFNKTLGQVFRQVFLGVKKNKIQIFDGEYRLLNHLHEWMSEGMRILENDIRDYVKYHGLKKSRQYRNLWKGKGVVIHSSVDISGGPIAIQEGVQIESFTCLKGPLVIGKNSIISPHSYIKHSIVGDAVKVGGEVSNSIINNYSNKAHYGYLGNSYVGEWVNIGAGAITSNLKNNYRLVTYIDSQNKKTNSGETFFGSFLGDFSKIGINTSLSPGTVVGMGASVSGIIDGYVKGFSIRNSGKQEGFIRLSAFKETHKKMFFRRNFHLSDEYWKKLEKNYYSLVSNNLR